MAPRAGKLVRKGPMGGRLLALFLLKGKGDGFKPGLQGFQAEEAAYGKPWRPGSLTLSMPLWLEDLARVLPWRTSFACSE